MIQSSPEPPQSTAIKQGGPSITTTTTAHNNCSTISTVHPDVLLTHILSRLDGPTLASASCATTQLQSLSTQEHLWSDICHATWHSTYDPRIIQLISTFPNGPRSFFSDSFPLLSSNLNPLSSSSSSSNPHPTDLISAVDIHYKNNLIFSKVQETLTSTNWFNCSPFRIDLLDPKDIITTKIENIKNISQDLNENLILSWIIIDPIQRRSANLSSWRPVSVQRHWLSGEIQVRFATILRGGNNINTTTTELVQCEILVAFWGCENGEIQIREVSLKIEDMDGITLNGKDSLDILQVGIERGERKKGKNREERREKYKEYLRMKNEREEMKLRRERRLDSLCATMGVLIFTVFLILVFYR